jgi:hypothetical protein
VPDEEFLPLRRDLYVPVGGLNARSLQLEPAPSKWYEQWWVWGALGVAAAVTTTVVAITLDEPKPTGNVRVTMPLAGTE